MGINSVVISLDNASATYTSHLSPTPVTGKVVIVISEKDEEVTGLVLHFKGAGKTSWTERRGKYTHTYGSTHRFFNNTVRLLGNGNGDKVTLQCGEHGYSFSFVLPPSMPSSFWADVGCIKYKLETVVERSWKTNLKTTRKLEVFAPFDLSLSGPEVMQPETKKAERTFGVFGSSGPLTLTVSVPTRGIVIGQQYPVTIQLDNNSNVAVKEVIGTIKKYVIFHSKTKSHTKRRTKVLCTFKPDAIGKNKASKSTVILPKLNEEPVNVDSCNNINIFYLLRVKVVTSAMHHNVKVHIPVRFGSPGYSGTIQNGGARVVTAIDLPSHRTIQNGGAGTAAASDLPPSYQEAVEVKEGWIGMDF